MRQITQDATQAFKDGETFSRDNTKVMGGSTSRIMTLHDNVIASIEDDRLLLTDSGWQTVTTKERLNGILSAFNSEWRVYQRAGKWYITDGMGKRQDWNGILELTV